MHRILLSHGGVEDDHSVQGMKVHVCVSVCVQASAASGIVLI